MVYRFLKPGECGGFFRKVVIPAPRSVKDYRRSAAYTVHRPPSKFPPVFVTLSSVDLTSYPSAKEPSTRSCSGEIFQKDDACYFFCLCGCLLYTSPSPRD